MDLSDVSAMLDQAESTSSPTNAGIMAALEHVVGRLHSIEAAVNELLSGLSCGRPVLSALWQTTATVTIRRGAAASPIRLLKACRW
ncbi:unnamed protein product [Haemonchus placei]|uniref:Histidine kinase n=1 Tax=Haemonchus placei TaxID=6290 RepID=A0A0N4X4E4_HAEPC|nr:unnamed protein product [Haemonchus placei]